MPCLTAAPVTSGKPQADGVRMRWHEFQFTFFDFPGQTLYHDGLLVERDGSGALFFAEDSFTPSGIDDYCLQNRDFVRQGEGYLRCLDTLRRLPRNVWLVNQHVPPTFRFSAQQFQRMHTELLKRMATLQEMVPWPDPDYAIDDNWAAVYPFANEVHAGQKLNVSMRILNHAPQRRNYRVTWNIPTDWKIVQADHEVAIAAHAQGEAHVAFTAEGTGLSVITADVNFDGRELREWAEALVRIKPR